MISYCSIEYLLVFLPAVLLGYLVLPKHLRRVLLLAASYGFFWYLSGPLLLWHVAVCAAVWLIGLRMKHVLSSRGEALGQIERKDREARRRVREAYSRKLRMWTIFSSVICFGILLSLKYTPFFLQNLNAVLARTGTGLQFEIPVIAVPIGISFYTLQAMSYVFDVRNEKLSAEGNFFRLTLWLSFFPLLMEGPIVRYAPTAEQIWEVDRIRGENFQKGLWRILYGVMKKLVVADRVNMAVELLYTDFAKYDGGMVFLAAVLFTVQEYMEFSGTIDIVIGTGECFGFFLPENFRQPFFSKTISEFWTRWHITLGAWLRDYIFYPLSMSAPLKKLTKKCRARFGNHYGPVITGAVALFAVWLFNGLWHGAGWSYIFFGMYHFTLITAGSFITPVVMSFCEKHSINRQSAPYAFFQRIRTALLVAIGEMFFRALSLKHGLQMFVRIFRHASLRSFVDGTALKLGMDLQDYLVILVVIAFVFVISLLKERDVDVRQKLYEKPVLVRALITALFVSLIVLFGAYGAGYVPVDPIYANF